MHAACCLHAACFWLFCQASFVCIIYMPRVHELACVLSCSYDGHALEICVCVCACVRARVFVCVYVCIYVCMYVCIYDPLVVCKNTRLVKWPGGTIQVLYFMVSLDCPDFIRGHDLTSTCTCQHAYMLYLPTRTQAPVPANTQTC